MDDRTLDRLEESLRRCNADRLFLDRFYDRFLRSSPKVRRKFAGTDFVRQKRMLQASLQLMLVAAQGGSFSAEHGLGPLLQDSYDRLTAPELRALSGRLQALLAPAQHGRPFRF